MFTTLSQASVKLVAEHKDRSPKMKRRSFCGLLGGAVLAGSFANPIRAAGTDTVSINFWHYQTSNVDALQAMIAGFMEKNPDVKVIEQFKHQDNMGAEIQAAAMAGRAPDVAQVISRITLGLVQNARPVAMQEAPDGGAFLNGIASNFLEIGRYDGKLYALPQSFGTLIVYYNKDLFRAAGLNAETAPATWDDIRAAARQITEKTAKPGLFILRAGRDIAPQTMLVNAGAEILSPDLTRATFATPDGIEAMQLWQDMAVTDKSLSVLSDKEGTALFSAGQMGILIRSVASLRGLIRDTAGVFELGVTNYPRWKNRARRTPNTGASLMMFSREERKREATFRFLAYMMSPEMTNHWSLVSGYLPMAAGARDSDVIRAAVAAEPRWGTGISQMDDLVATARWPGSRAIEMQIAMENMMEQVWHGTAPAREIVPAAEAEITQLIAQGT
jgi:multiple sugar transport system substrate-binding protein